MYKRLIQTALVFGMLATAPPLAAQSVPCGPRASFVDQLQSKYGETRQAMGLRGNKVIFELWSSDNTGTWSILATQVDGRTCVIASGQNWQTAPGDTNNDPAT